MFRLGLCGVLCCLAGQPAFAQLPALPGARGTAPPGPAVSPGLRGLSPPTRHPAPPPAPTLAPAEKMEVPETLSSFDPHTVNVTWQDRNWQLTAGEAVLKDFGRRQQDAREALRLIRELGLSERGTVGGQRPVIEYWLTRGQPPRWIPSRLRPVVFDRASLRVEQSQLHWCVRDDHRVLFDFGREAEDARRTHAILLAHGFNQVAVVGQGRPTMMVFFAGPGGSATAPHAGTMGRGPHFPRPRRDAPKTAKSDTLRKSMRSRYPGIDLDQIITPAVPLLADLTDNASGSGGPLASRRPVAPYPTLEPSPMLGRGTASLPTLSYTGRSTGAVQLGGSIGVGQFPRRTAFDWRQAEVRREDGSWKLMAGKQELARFGEDEQAARQALGVIRHYRFTERVEPAPSASLRSLGGDDRRLRPPLQRQQQREPEFAYFLVHGKAPTGLMPGLQGRSFEPHRVTIRQAGFQWVVCTREGTLMLCGPDFNRARRVRDAIQQHRFDHLYHIGPAQPGEGMTFLVKERK
jgi:hypothetical protein